MDRISFSKNLDLPGQNMI